MRISIPTIRLPAVLFATALALVAGSARAVTLPPPVANGNPGLQRVGAGELRWLGRPVYEASLWTSHGSFQGYGAGGTVALSLWYQREFSRDELLRITATAWRLLDSVPPQRRERWLATLRSFWTDVGPGHNVTTVVEPGRVTRFYDQRGLMGEVDDPEFGPAFLSIWLDPRSVVGDLRVQLLGSGAADARR